MNIMKYICLRLVICQLILISTPVAWASFEAPPDTRTWEQVTADFVKEQDARNSFHGKDGLRLKELDPKRAVEFLMPFLAKDRPLQMRMKAIGGLGQAAFQEAVPTLSKIAKDVTDDENVRAQALNPGLRYMNNPMAVEAAASVVADKSRAVRISAYWVLSDSGTEEAVKALEGRIQTKDLSFFELQNLIHALNFTKHPRAAMIIFANCDFQTLPNDESLLSAYSSAMEQSRIPEAQKTMLRIAQQPDCRISAYYALLYFSSFPSEDVVPALN